MARVFTSTALPRLTSTRDSRDRVDLVTEELFGTTDLRADRITYHPGDSAAPHYHRDCQHVFFVLAGRGVLQAGDSSHELTEGDVALVEANEVHSFTNPHDADFSFIELWVPAPSETVWVDAGDV